MRRVIALVVVGTSFALVAPADAKLATLCNLVTDRTGDAYWNPAGYVPVLPPGTAGSDDAMDITSADVASDTRMITGVLRVKQLSSASVHAPAGMSWRVGFTAGRFSFALAGHASTTGSPAFDASYSTVDAGATYGLGATGVFDTARSEVRITVPLSLLAAQTDIKPGTILRGITGETAQEIRVPNVIGPLGLSSMHSVDRASGDTVYVAGEKSCVRVGS